MYSGLIHRTLVSYILYFSFGFVCLIVWFKYLFLFLCIRSDLDWHKTLCRLSLQNIDFALLLVCLNIVCSDSHFASFCNIYKTGTHVLSALPVFLCNIYKTGTHVLRALPASFCNIYKSGTHLLTGLPAGTLISLNWKRKQNI